MMSYKQLNIRLPAQELKILNRYANKTQRTKTDILREFIRSLKNSNLVLEQTEYLSPKV